MCGAKIPVASLPVHGHDFDAAGHDAFHEHERQVGLAGTASAGDEDVLLETVLSQEERVQLLRPVGHSTELDVAPHAELFSRRRERRAVRLIVLFEVLGGQEFQHLFDVGLAGRVGLRDVHSPQLVDLSAEDGFQFTAQFLGSGHHWASPSVSFNRATLRYAARYS